MATITAPLNDVITTLDDGSVLNVGLMDQVFAYKLLMNLVQVINLVLVWWLLGRALVGKPRARLAAFIVFAWNPMMLFDVAGNAHNDALTVTLLLLGLAPLVARQREPSNAAWLSSRVSWWAWRRRRRWWVSRSMRCGLDVWTPKGCSKLGCSNRRWSSPGWRVLPFASGPACRDADACRQPCSQS